MDDRIKKVSLIFGYIGGAIALITGCIQIYDRFFSRPDIDVFKENIYFTSSNSGTGLFDFLDRNIDKTIYIDNMIYAGLGSYENNVINDKCNFDSDNIFDEGSVVSNPIALPDYNDGDFGNYTCEAARHIIFDKGQSITFEYGSGGTGVEMFRFRGFFELTVSYQSGHRVFYRLKEADVSFDIRHSVTN